MCKSICTRARARTTAARSSTISTGLRRTGRATAAICGRRCSRTTFSGTASTSAARSTWAPRSPSRWATLPPLRRTWPRPRPSMPPSPTIGTDSMSTRPRTAPRTLRRFSASTTDAWTPTLWSRFTCAPGRTRPPQRSRFSRPLSTKRSRSTRSTPRTASPASWSVATPATPTRAATRGF
eukprot:Amastigsp_a846731_39.p3 type:complete len:180 gc:universal Amastigsp_a846731_39:1051-512(-)